MKRSHTHTQHNATTNYNEPSSMKAVLIFFVVVTTIAITVISLTGSDFS